MSATKELDRIASEIARELEPKMFEMISWGLTKTDLDDVEGDEFTNWYNILDYIIHNTKIK